MLETRRGARYAHGLPFDPGKEDHPEGVATSRRFSGVRPKFRRRVSFKVQEVARVDPTVQYDVAFEGWMPFPLIVQVPGHQDRVAGGGTTGVLVGQEGVFQVGIRGAHQFNHLHASVGAEVLGTAQANGIVGLAEGLQPFGTIEVKG